MKRFTHVGVTNRLYESVAAIAASIKRPLSGPAYAGGSENTMADVEQHPHWEGPPEEDVDESGGMGDEAADGGAGEGGGDGAGADGAGGGSGGADGAGTGPSVSREEAVRLHKEVRAARMAMQDVQRRMHVSVRRAGVQPKELEELKTEINVRRKALKEAQEALAKANKVASASGWRLPFGKHGGDYKDDGVIKSVVKKVTGGGMLPENLGREFVKCASRAQARNLQRRDSSLAAMKMPDGRSPKFSKEARKRITADIIEYIRCGGGCEGRRKSSRQFQRRRLRLSLAPLSF